MTSRDRNKTIGIIGKLLAKAESLTNTPEGDTYEERAFRLLAKHGIDYSEVQAGQIASDAIVRDDVPVHGDYLHQQIMLLARIASALHCSTAYWLHGRTAATVEVYGVQRHLDRVHLLYAPLRTRMLRQVEVAPRSASAGVSIHDHQVSWMQGFSLSIRARLRVAETEVAAEADRRIGTDLHTRTLAADAKRAEIAKKQTLPHARPSIHNPDIARDSLVDGYQAGTDVNLERPGP